MNRTLGPTGLVLVGAAFICLFLAIAVASASSQANLPDLSSQLRESVSAQRSSALEHSGFESVPRSEPSKESISLTELNSSCQVSDMTSVNSEKERNIVCNEVQDGDPDAMGLVNNLDLKISGQNTEIDTDLLVGEPRDDIEEIVDKALNSCSESSSDTGMSPEQRAQSSQQLHLGNNVNVDVHGISVSALNTAEGGSAVATSNIIIKPVQIIVCPSEVEEKLK
jgi:hypothetical protein